ncbi:MAG: hypothetical protein RL186_137 [Pseudomonadota bacterium]|jgi:GMP synthase-like glutamine amidotransferase
MKLTIIETGRPPDPIAADFPTYPAMMDALLRPYVPQLTPRVVSLVSGEALPDLREVDAVLITGSPVGVYDDVAWIAPLKAWVVEAGQRRIPQVGICFGHQILAEAFGGHAHKAPQGWGLGCHSYQVTAKEPWMTQIVPDTIENIRLAVSHQDQVLRPPAGSRTIARSEFTPHAALIYDNAPILSFQGHPEFCNRFADALIRSRRGTRFAEDLADRALKSLDQPLDGHVVAAWIAGFYTSHKAGAPKIPHAVAA